jgi:hypothetical protein
MRAAAKEWKNLAPGENQATENVKEKDLVTQ